MNPSLEVIYEPFVNIQLFHNINMLGRRKKMIFNSYARKHELICESGMHSDPPNCKKKVQYSKCISPNSKFLLKIFFFKIVSLKDDLDANTFMSDYAVRSLNPN